MERTLSAEERIRRAEEIYYRRKMQNTGVRVSANSTNNGAKLDYKLLHKMILQILICVVIYIIYYLIQNTNYIFSDDVIDKTKEVLSYDINFTRIYKEVSTFVSSKINKESNNEENSNDMENSNNIIEEDPQIQNEQDVNSLKDINKENIEITEESIGGIDANIGGAEAMNFAENNNIESDLNSTEGLSQMEIDANYIKEKYNLIRPIEGTITSRYGYRNPTTSSVPKNHTGIDIAANTGTIIYAALDGVVKIASSEGDYGKHLRIEKDDLAIYYAHCSKLYVSEGQEIRQGDAIAEVGATGNVTGPHLHFEIRREERYVNPDLILQF